MVTCTMCHHRCPDEDATLFADGYVCMDCEIEYRRQRAAKDEEARNEFISRQGIEFYDSWMNDAGTSTADILKALEEGYKMIVCDELFEIKYCAENDYFLDFLREYDRMEQGA